MKREQYSAADLSAIADYLQECEHDPYRFVQLSFPWGEEGTPLENKRGPKEWQAELLAQIRDGIKTPDEVIRTAIASGHGIGKSALVAWLIMWGLSTKLNCRGVVTANTEKQLQTKTWPELNKWYQMWIAKDCFVCTATALFAADPQREKTWRVDAIPWSKENPEAFAGLHNEGSRIMIIFDEASAIEDIIWEVAEGALTDTNTEIIWCVFGNPTRRDGRFYECFHRDRDYWWRRQIDSRTVEGSNLEEINSWAKRYGEDSDFFKIRVKGQFPASNENQYIPTQLIDKARNTVIKPYQFEFAPRIIGVDSSWTGKDKLIMYFRQGLFCERLCEVQKNDNDIRIANMLAQYEDERQADAVFIDLGFGTGIKSAGDAWGRNWTLVAFGAKSSRADCLNKRAEMWANAKDWLNSGGAIPADDQELADDLALPELAANTKGLIQLERKEKIKERAGRSPDYADSFVLTFAYPVRRKEKYLKNEQQAYDPFAGL